MSTKLLKRIEESKYTKGNILPKLENLKFVRYAEGWNMDYDQGYSSDPYTWMIYIAHDSCHDTETSVYDRNTVIAINRYNKEYTILGLELRMQEALDIANGIV